MSEWKETHRALVFPWNCDHYGHMNVRFYFDHFDDSAFHAWEVLGDCRAVLRGAGLSAVTARNTVSYVKEMPAGMLFAITVGVTRVGNKSVGFTHRLHDCETGELCATMNGVEVIFDPETRRAAALPEALRERLNDLLVETEEPARPAKSPSTSSPQSASGRWHEVHRGLVFPWRCDHYGHMNARYYAHHFDDGGFHLFSMAGVDVAGLLERGLALVTAQTEISYVKEMLPGTLFVIRSGFSHVGGKSMRHFHRMKNVESGEVHATMEGVDVVFDMESRKAVAIPVEVRATLLENLVEL